MAKLKENVQRFIVQEFACFKTPSEVAKLVKDEFGIELTRQQCSIYDAAKLSSRTLAKKWRVLFEDTRKAYREKMADIPIANQSYRLEQLQMLYQEAYRRKNVALCSQLMEQAAKELGGMFTAKRLLEHTGKDGQPIQTETQIVNRLNFNPVGSE